MPLGEPIRWHRIVRQPLGGQTHRLVTRHDRLDDRRRQESQVDDLHHPARGKPFGFGDFFEALTLLDRIVILLRLGDIADQNFVTGFDGACTDDQLRFDTTLAVLSHPPPAKSLQPPKN